MRDEWLFRRTGANGPTRRRSPTNPHPEPDARTGGVSRRPWAIEPNGWPCPTCSPAPGPGGDRLPRSCRGCLGQSVSDARALVRLARPTCRPSASAYSARASSPSRGPPMPAKGTRSKVNKVVLAYSGGLDTSIILKWLQETYQAEVITFTADLGQGEELEPARRKAEMLGVKKDNIFIEDLREEFILDYV